MGSSKVHALNPPIRVDISGDSGDDVLSPLGLLRVQMPQIFGGFAGLNFLQDVVDSGFRQGLVPKCGISKNFYFISAFSGSGKTGHEIADFRHSDSWQG
jgi:hypothetical protein